MHSRINHIPLESLNKTHAQRSNAADSVAASEGLIERIEESMLVSNQEIINTDHRAHIIDANLEECFNEEFSH